MSSRPFKEKGKGQEWASAECSVGGEWLPTSRGMSWAAGVWACVGQVGCKEQHFRRHLPTGSLWMPLMPAEPVARMPPRVCGSPPSWPGELQKPLSSVHVFVCSQLRVCPGVHGSSPGQGPTASLTLTFPLRGRLSAQLPGLPGAPDPVLRLRTRQDEPPVRTVQSRWSQRRDLKRLGPLPLERQL